MPRARLFTSCPLNFSTALCTWDLDGPKPKTVGMQAINASRCEWLNFQNVEAEAKFPSFRSKVNVGLTGSRCCTQ